MQDAKKANDLMNALVAEWRLEETKERERLSSYLLHLANKLCQAPEVAALCFSIIKTLKEEKDEYHTY